MQSAESHVASLHCLLYGITTISDAVPITLEEKLSTCETIGVYPIPAFMICNMALVEGIVQCCACVICSSHISWIIYLRNR